uniref:Uncharacterized protein n=1 Tax=Caenorhabditis japonica TaxID=281687 RepID=A0A8R1IBV2_CAEJA
MPLEKNPSPLCSKVVSQKIMISFSPVLYMFYDKKNQRSQKFQLANVPALPTRVNEKDPSSLEDLEAQLAKLRS